MSENLIALLDAVADESRSVQAMDLTELSDLARGQVALFRTAWDALTPTRRLALISAMVEQAEANIHLNFHAILRACLNDGDPQIRQLAIEGLWEDNKITLVRPLIDLLNDDPAVDVRAAAAISLGRYVLLGALGEIADAPARQVETALLAAWERAATADADPVAVRRRALESLACSGIPAIYDMIHSAYYDESELMRQSAVFAMGRSADARWARFVLAELHNHQPAMRFESALAAGEMGLRQAVQPLIGRLDDPDSSVREAAVTALGKIGGPAARRALLALLDGQDEVLAQAAEDALDELTFGSHHLETLLPEGAADRSYKRHDDEDEFDDREDDEFDDREDDEAAIAAGDRSDLDGDYGLDDFDLEDADDGYRLTDLGEEDWDDGDDGLDDEDDDLDDGDDDLDDGDDDLDWH